VAVDLASDDAQQRAAVRRAQQRDRVGADVLVARRHQLVARWQVHPQLQTVEQAAAGDQPLRRALDVQNPAARRHPLRVAIGDHAAATVRVLVLERAVDHVRDGFEPAVGMPRRALRLARRVLDLAHLVEVNERIQISQRHTGERATNGKTLAFEAARSGGDRSHRAQPRATRVESSNAWKGECVRGNGWHFKKV
jgi:hypothetical protein